MHEHSRRTPDVMLWVQGSAPVRAFVQVPAGGINIDTRPWTLQSTPAVWLAALRGPFNALLPQSSCELEADCIAPDILNRRHAVRRRLADATEHDRLVESLALIWQEERARRGGASPPPPPPSPPRRPMDVCALVTAARVDFEGIVRAVRRTVLSQLGSTFDTRTVIARQDLLCTSMRVWPTLRTT